MCLFSAGKTQVAGKSTETLFPLIWEEQGTKAQSSSGERGFQRILQPCNNEIPSSSLVFAPDSEIQKLSIAGTWKYQSVLQYWLLLLPQEYLLKKTQANSTSFLLLSYMGHLYETL